MGGYKTSLIGIGVIAIGVFCVIVLLNQVDGSRLFTRSGNAATDGQQQGSVSADLPNNVLRTELRAATDTTSTSEIVVIADGQIRVLSSDPDAPEPVIAVIDATDPQAVVWAKDRLYWIEKRTVQQSGSRQSTQSFVLVEAVVGGFDASQAIATTGAPAGSRIEKRDVYRSERSIESLRSHSSGQLLSFIEGENTADRAVFVYAAKTQEVKRVAKEPVSVAWSPSRLALVVSSAQEPRPKTAFFEFSANGEVKTTIDLPAEFGGYGLSFLDDATVAGLVWSASSDTLPSLQTVDLRSNELVTIGEVQENSDARTVLAGAAAALKRSDTPYPTTQSATGGKTVLITIPNRVNSVYTLESKNQTYLRIDEEPVGFLTAESVLVKREFDLFSVGLKSGIQTTVASDVTAAALRK